MELGRIRAILSRPQMDTHIGGKSQGSCNRHGLGRAICWTLLQIRWVGGGRSLSIFFYFLNIYFADLFGEHGYIFIE